MLITHHVTGPRYLLFHQKQKLMKIGGRQITRYIEIIQDLKEKKNTGAYDRSFTFDKKFQ